MKTWMWIVLVVIVLLVIGYFVLQNQQAKSAANISASTYTTGKGDVSGGSKVADVLSALLPFYSAYKSDKQSEAKAKEDWISDCMKKGATREQCEIIYDK